MRILLTEKQFNLIILSEGRSSEPPLTMDEIKKMYNDILDKYKGTGEIFITKFKSDKNKSVDNPEYRFLRDYKYDFSGRIRRGEKHKNLLIRFYEDGGKEGKSEVMDNKPKTPEEIKKMYNEILNTYKGTGKTIKSGSDDYKFLQNNKYDFSGVIPKYEKHDNLLKRFYEDGGKEGKSEVMDNKPKTPEEIKEMYYKILDTYKGTGKTIKSNSKEYVFLGNYYYDFSGRIPDKGGDKNIGSLLDRFLEDGGQEGKFGKIDNTIKTPKEIKKIYNDILNHFVKNIDEKLKEKSKEHTFLYNYYYDFSGRITGKRDENTESLLNRFKDEYFEKVGKKITKEYWGERYIADFLKNTDEKLKEGRKVTKGVDFIRQHRFPDLRSLPLDIYLPEYKKHKIIIEFDGAQHFIPIKWSKNRTDEEAQLDFENIKNRDELKNKYCADNGIKLYRIKNNITRTVNKESVNKIMNIIYHDFKNGYFNNTFDKVGYLETEESKKNASKMNTNPMANFNESIYRILNDFKKQYIY